MTFATQSDTLSSIILLLLLTLSFFFFFFFLLLFISVKLDIKLNYHRCTFLLDCPPLDLYNNPELNVFGENIWLIAPNNLACCGINESYAIGVNIPMSGIPVLTRLEINNTVQQCNGTSLASTSCNVTFSLDKPGNYSFNLMFDHKIRGYSNNTIVIVATGK